MYGIFLSVKLGFRLQKAVLKIPDSLWLTKIQGSLLSSPHSASEAVVNLGTKGRWNLTPACQDKNLNSLYLIYEREKRKKVEFCIYLLVSISQPLEMLSHVFLKSKALTLWKSRGKEEWGGWRKAREGNYSLPRSAVWQTALLPTQANNFEASGKWWQKLFHGWCSLVILLKLLWGCSITRRNLLLLLF